MAEALRLEQLLDETAALHPQRIAVEDEAGTSISYEDLVALSRRTSRCLSAMGVGPSDRVGLYVSKSIEAVAAIFGILRTGAAYVPVDPGAPASRNAYIFQDCGVKAAIVEDGLVDALRGKLASPDAFPLLRLPTPLDGSALTRALEDESEATEETHSDSDATAYLLYTSGSTGEPKGVVLTHRNALSFVNWCSGAFQPSAEDRFSSHAPFHFDLSILDLYLPLKHGATLVLIGSRLGKDPAQLAPFIADRRITSWYSTPTVLSLLVQYGDLPQRDLSALRLVLFAGEVFPVQHLREIKNHLPQPRYFNLYGPTETNVCTYYEVPSEIPDDRAEPYPIGPVCEHLRSRVVDEQGADVSRGVEGELCIQGPAVTQGYWKRPELTEAVFLSNSDGVEKLGTVPSTARPSALSATASSGAPRTVPIFSWYKTGDLVIEDESGAYIFRGRRDRMVKKRGFRVELGEIEACLDSHPAVAKAAVVALPQEDGLQIKAFASPRDNGKLSIIALKGFCSQRLPSYMVPDRFSFPSSLPMTSTDKIDYQKLKELD